MRVVRAAGQNVSPSDDGRLYDQIFSDGLFNEPTFTNLGGNNVQVGAIYGDLCGRDFTVEQMTLTVTLPEGEGETTGYIYVEIDTSSEDVITLNSALAPFTPTYEDINTNGAVAQMVLAEYTASAVAVTSVTPVYQKSTAGSIAAGSVATVENAQAVNAHAKGDYILLNSKLYIVTAAVSVGETFVEGTNITATSIGGELKALNKGLTEIVEEMLPLTYNGKGVNIYFRKWGNVLSILFTKDNESMTLPTTWTRLGTLTNIKAPSGSTRFIPFVSSNGLTGTFRLWEDGAVTFVANSTNAYWMQSSATVVL